MSHSRLRPGFALLAASALAAAVFASGCAAPKSSEKARFGTVVGTVVDAAGNPVPGAQVTIVPRAASGAIGTLNYNGDTGPFVTDSRGRFFIQGITLQPTDTAVLNLRVAREGFVPTVASVTTNSAVTIGGRTIPAGAQTPDIVVSGEVVTNVVANMQGLGQVAEIGSSGGTITAGVPNPNGGSLGTATVTFPAGAITQPTVISVTPLTGSALPGGVQIVPGSASGQLGPGQSVTAQVPLAAVNLEPSGLTFPAGLEPTIVLPIGIGLPVGTTLPVLVFDPVTSNWVFLTNATVLAGGTTVSFRPPHFSTDMVVLTETWTEGALSATLETVVFPPIATFPDGYIAKTRLSQTLTFPGATDTEQAALANAFGAITHQEANGAFPVSVPAGSTLGIRAERHTVPVTVTATVPGVGTRTFTGTRSEWLTFIEPIAQVPTPPVHLQGHIQSVGAGS